MKSRKMKETKAPHSAALQSEPNRAQLIDWILAPHQIDLNLALSREALAAGLQEGLLSLLASQNRTIMGQLLIDSVNETLLYPRKTTNRLFQDIWLVGTCRLVSMKHWILKISQPQKADIQKIAILLQDLATYTRQTNYLVKVDPSQGVPLRKDVVDTGTKQRIYIVRAEPLLVVPLMIDEVDTETNLKSYLVQLDQSKVVPLMIEEVDMETKLKIYPL